MIVPRPFADMLEITGTSFADVMADIVSVRDQIIGEMKYDVDHRFRFKSNNNSRSTALSSNWTSQNTLGPLMESLPTFSGVYDGETLEVSFIDYGDVRYIVKEARVEVVLLKKTLPKTVLQSIIDDPLHGVLRHDMIKEGRSIVAKARQSGDSIALDCSRDLVEIDPDGRIIREV